jgi:hypothetical protein
MPHSPWLMETLDGSVTVRVPQGVIDALDARAARLNVPRSEVVRAAFYGLTGPEGWPSEHPALATLDAIHRELEKA